MARKINYPPMPPEFDRWTSCGFGMIPAPLTPEQKAVIDQINAEMEAERQAHAATDSGKEALGE